MKPWNQLAVWLLGIVAHSAWELSQARGPRERTVRLVAVAFFWSGNAAAFGLGYGWRSATGERIPTWAVAVFVTLWLGVWCYLMLRARRVRAAEQRERDARPAGRDEG